jgi:hypothetical protein
MFYVQHVDNITAKAPSSRGAHAKGKPTSIMVLQLTAKWGLKYQGK